MKTREEMLEQLANGSCIGIVCENCPLSFNPCTYIPRPYYPSSLPPKIVDAAKSMIMDKEVEEFLGED